MGVRIASSGNNTIQNAVLNGNGTTVGMLTGLIGLVQDNAQVLILWYCTVLIGTAITAITPTLRRGALVSSTLVNQSIGLTATAGTTIMLSGSYVDTPGVVGQVQYNITLNPTGAANNSTLNDASIIAMVL